MMASIEDTIQSVERLYQSVTGQQAPGNNGEPYSPIPPEADASRHVEQQLLQLVQKVQEAFGAEQAVVWSPPLTVRDEQGERIVELDLPGVARDSVSVIVSGDFLTIAGHRTPPPAGSASGTRVVHNECSFGPFERTLPLPEGVTAQQITAELRDGVLKVRVPRAGRQAEPRPVPVT